MRHPVRKTCQATLGLAQRGVMAARDYGPVDFDSARQLALVDLLGVRSQREVSHARYRGDRGDAGPDGTARSASARPAALRPPARLGRPVFQSHTDLFRQYLPYATHAELSAESGGAPIAAGGLTPGRAG